MQGNGSTIISVDALAADLRARGVNPATAVSCAPSAGLPGHVPGVAGCPLYDRCIFNLRRYGGFKGRKRSNVGYYLKTHEGKPKEDFTSCDRFMATLHARMRSGERDRDDGMKNAEIIEIIAQEGETIHAKVWGPVDETDKRPNAPYEMKRLEVRVPVFKYPEEGAEGIYEDMVEKRRREREARNPDRVVGPAARVDPKADAGDDGWGAAASAVAEPEPAATATVEAKGKK